MGSSEEPYRQTEPLMHSRLELNLSPQHRGKTSIILPSISSTQRDREHEGKKENKHLAPQEIYTLNSMQTCPLLYPECSLRDSLSDTEALALLSSHERVIRAR